VIAAGRQRADMRQLETTRTTRVINWQEPRRAVTRECTRDGAYAGTSGGFFLAVASLLDRATDKSFSSRKDRAADRDFESPAFYRRYPDIDDTHAGTHTLHRERTNRGEGGEGGEGGDSPRY